MLTVYEDGFIRNCEGVSRRELLRIGALGLGGMSLPGLMASKASAAAAGTADFVRDKSVVVLFLAGGATHIETFDPKMTAPSEYRAMFGEVKTSLPGVTFGSHFPTLAKLADRMAIVRSFSHGNGSHGPAAALVASGGHPSGASMGALYARLAGVSSPTTGLPTNALIVPRAIGDKYKNIGSNSQRVSSTGSLPEFYKPFDPSAGGKTLQDMKLTIPQGRLDDRKTLLARLDRIRRGAESDGALDDVDRYTEQAFDVIMGGVGDAFNLKKEDPRIVERYDTSKMDIPASLYKKKNKNLKKQSPVTLGKQMLMARRLVESGCRFVTVTSAGWDMHGNAFGIDDGMPLLGSAVDKAVSAFIEDLEARGMSDDVLLVITGEFGRTPRINKKGGRDHWGKLCTLAFAGGGLKMGQVIGESDRTASVPATPPVRPSHLLGTVMHTMFDIGKLRIEPGVPRDLLSAIESAKPIPQLV